MTFRQERIVAGVARHMGRGNGYLATIGAISPFVGLFGTVWGIMNSFIGIAHSQTTNLAVVAPDCRSTAGNGTGSGRGNSCGRYLQHLCPYDLRLPW